MSALFKTFVSVSAPILLIFLATAEAMAKNPSQPTERQLATSPPLLPPNIGTGIGGLAGLLPAVMPMVLLLGLGAFILPAIGLLLFGGSGGFGGLFEGFSKKRSASGNPLFSTEKLVELMQTFTKALEEAAKED